MDYFSNARRNSIELVRRQYNQCANPWGYQELGPRSVRISFRGGVAIAAFLACVAFWAGFAVLLGRLG